MISALFEITAQAFDQTCVIFEDAAHWLKALGL